MSNATVFPTSSNLFIGQWSRPDVDTPRLSAPIDADDTIIKVSTPLKNNAGTIVTGKFLMGIKQSSGWTEVVWVPANAVSVDGLTIGTTLIPVVRGIKPDGYDYTAGSASFADSHDADELVFCVIPAVIPELMRSAIQGLIATGGSNFILGTDAAGTVTVSRSTGTGTYVGFLRWYTTSGKVEFSNAGSVWTAIDDSAASVIFKVSSGDTTPGYAEDKIQAGSNITITKINTGANEYLEIATSLPDQVSSHAIYTPAYLTGGGSTETNPAVWDSVSDGSFRITIDGTAYNIDAIDFTTAVGGDMDDMAAIIQVAIRAATGSTETCVWSTDRFVITSADTTSSSEVSVTTTSTGTVGTDISGAGAGAYMDADTGHGTATGPVIDPTQDIGKVALLSTAKGNFNEVFAGNATIMTAGETLDGTSTPVAVYVSDGSNSRTAGRVYKADSDDLTNMAVRFYGFIRESVSAGESVVVYHDGIVAGFTGLTQGVNYYLSTTAGAISTTIYNPAVQVGHAISTTEIMIEKTPLVVQVAHATALTSGSMPLEVTTTVGFRPRAIIANGAVGSGAKGTGAWNFASLIYGGGSVGGSHLSSEGSDHDASNTFTFFTDGATSITEQYALTVLSVTSNTFTVRWTGASTPDNITANVYYLVFG